MKLLFWNVAKQPRPDLIRAIRDEHDIDIIALAEPGDDLSPLISELNKGALQLFSLVESVAKKVAILSRLPTKSVELVSDDERVFVRHLAPPIGLDAILVAVHLPSKLHMSEHEQLVEAIRLRTRIDEAELKYGHSRTIVVGDLNMNPFEAGIVAADGLHAVMDRRIAAKGERTVNGVERKFLYNPMWKFFGNGVTRTLGTYFRSDSSNICYFWNVFDQVLVRPALLEFFADEDVKILEKVGDTSLLRPNGRIDKDISDHLPVVAALDLERVVDR